LSAGGGRFDDRTADLAFIGLRARERTRNRWTRAAL
jgi:hypothetical protein